MDPRPLKERNLQAVRKYYQAHHEEIMRRLALKRIQQGRTPRASTLERFGIQPQAEKLS